MALYWLRLFAIAVGYSLLLTPRLFDQRAFQFILVFLAQISAQKSVL